MRTEQSASLKYTYPVVVRITGFSGLILLISTFLIFPRVVNKVELDEEVQIIIEQIDIPQIESTRLNSSHTVISYAVFCLKKKKQK